MKSRSTTVSLPAQHNASCWPPAPTTSSWTSRCASVCFACKCLSCDLFKFLMFFFSYYLPSLMCLISFLSVYFCHTIVSFLTLCLLLSLSLSLSFSLYISLFLQLWNLNKPSSQNTMFGHFEPVNHCCFSPDDTYVSTSSNDGTVKVTAIKLDTCKAAIYIKLYLIYVTWMHSNIFIILHQCKTC